MVSFRRLFLDTLLPAICVLGIAYNCLIALNGDEGIRAHQLVKDSLTEKQDELAELEVMRDRLEKKARLLSLRTLDQDMLDESARRVLGYAAPDEVVISVNELEKLLLQKNN